MIFPFDRSGIMIGPTDGLRDDFLQRKFRLSKAYLVDCFSDPNIVHGYDWRVIGIFSKARKVNSMRYNINGRRGKIK